MGNNQAAQASYTHSAQVQIPGGIAAGTYYLLVQANGDGGQLESNYDNNVNASASFQVTSVDLTVPTVTVQGSGNFGQTIPVNWTVRDTGTSAATASWTDGIYLSANSTFDNSAVLLKRVPSGSYSPLAGGSSYNQNTTVTLPLSSQSANGTFYLFVVTNDQDQQPESSYADNASQAQTIGLTLPSLPDLVVPAAAITAPANAFNNQQILVSWTDQNIGTAAANGPWTDQIFYSTSSDGSHPVYLASAAYPGSLAAGATSVVLSQPVTLPATTGNIWIVVQTNADQGANEGPLNNNDISVSANPINVTQQPLPDLVVSSITPPTNVVAGTTVPVTYTVTNEGNAPTNATQWLDGVFISQSPSLELSPTDDIAFGVGAPLQIPVFVTNPSYLLPSDSYSQTVNVPFPVSASGTWYVYVVTNRSLFHTLLDNFIDVGPVQESNSTNDMTISSPFNVTLAPLPELTVAPVQTPPQAFSGQPLTVSWTVSNQGTGIAVGQALSEGAPIQPVAPTLPADSTWTDEVYMSPDPTLDSNAISLGTFQHNGALDAGAGYTNTQQVTLPVGVSGSYYFIVQTDIDGQVFESGSTAGEVNSTPSAITVNLTPPPDLQTTITSPVPGTALASHTLNFTYEVSNIGGGPTALSSSTAVWTDSFYLSPAQTYNAGTAILLGQQTYNGSLAAGASYTFTASETLPNALSGNYYLIVDADSGNAVFELDQTSKFGVSQDPMQIASKPADLVVSSVSGATSAQAGGSVLLNWTVTNQGTGDTAVSTWDDSIYADTGSTLSNKAILLASYTHNGLLDPHGSYTQSQLVPLPISLSSGSYNLFVVTDQPLPPPPGQNPSGPPVYEPSYADDTSAPWAISVTQTLADLQVMPSISAPNTVQSGSTVTVGWTVVNNSAATTNANYWYDDVWLSTKQTLDSGGTDYYLGTVQHSNPLAANATYSASLALTLPVSLPAGSYYFIVAVDRPVLPPGADSTTQNLVFESNEANNETAVAATVTPGPHLVVSDVSSPGPIDVGQQLAVSWTVTNTGAGGTGNVPIQDSVYLSYDQVLSPSSIYVGTVTQTGGVAAGGSYTQNATLDLRSGLQGTFYVFVVTDTNDNVYEPNPNDAVAYQAAPLVIQPVPPADLVAGTVTIPPNSVLGQDISIQYQVTNNGANPANGAWTDSLYLSPTQTWSVSDPLLGQVSEDMDLAPQGSYAGSLTATLPAVSPGSYYVIVRTNILDTIPETNLSNNLSASLKSTSLAVPSLTLGVPTTGTLAEAESVYYQVTVAAGQTLAINFSSQTASSLNELYVNLGNVPTRGSAQYTFQGFAANQQLTVPATQAGTYYIQPFQHESFFHNI